MNSIRQIASSAAQQTARVSPSNAPVNATPPNFTEAVSNQDVDQVQIDAAILSDLGPAAKMHAEQDISKLRGHIPTAGQLQSEFSKLAVDPEIPFEYIVNGCFARAHLMCDTLHKDQINSAKIFCMIDNPDTDALHAHNKYMDATWHHFHVAPLVYAQDENRKVVPFVVDPSMSDHPLKPQEWVRKMWDGKAPIHLDITRDEQYVPVEYDGANKTFEESMLDSHQTAAEFRTKLADIKEQYLINHIGHPAAQLAA